MTAKVIPYPERLERIERAADTLKKFGGTGGPPHNGDMEQRIKQLETDTSSIKTSLPRIETDVAVMRSNYVTQADLLALKSDLHQEVNTQTWKFITWTTGLFITISTALISAAYFIARHT